MKFTILMIIISVKFRLLKDYGKTLWENSDLNTTNAYYIDFDPEEIGWAATERWEGFVIRAVCS